MLSLNFLGINIGTTINFKFLLRCWKLFIFNMIYTIQSCSNSLEDTRCNWYQNNLSRSWDRCLESILFLLNALIINKDKQLYWIHRFRKHRVFNQECSNCNSLLRRNIIDIEDTYVDKLVSHPALLSGNKESRKQHYFLEMKQQFFQECSNHKGSFLNNGIMHIKHLSAGTTNIIHVRFIDYSSSTKITTFTQT